MVIETLNLNCSMCGAPLRCITDTIWKCDHCGSSTLIKITDDPEYVGNIGDTFIHDYIKFKIISVKASEVAIVECDPGLDGEVILPSFVKFNKTLYTVVEISNNAFANCNKIESLILPVNLRIIGNAAFEHAHIPDKFTIPETVEMIGNSAFQESTNLKSIKIPPSVKKIDEFAFHQCFDLECVELSEGLEHIGVMAFRRCMRLEKVYVKDCDARNMILCAAIPKTVKTVGKYVFDLTRITMMHVYKNTIVDPRQSITVLTENETVAKESENKMTVRSVNATPIQKKKGFFSRFK